MGAVVALAFGAGGIAVGTAAALDVTVTVASVVYMNGFLEGEKINTKPPHAPPTDDEAFPLPRYLEEVSYANSVNVGVFGASGAGKSTLINSLRGLRPNLEGAAPVGAKETTMVPTMYAYGELSAARLWDIPGAGTERFPRDTYIKDMGLRFFDAVVLVTSTRVTDIDRSIVAALQTFRVPCFVVRSKIDVDIVNEMEDNGLPEHVTRERVLDEVMHCLTGVSDVYLVSKRPDDSEMQRLRNGILASVAVKRREHEEHDCPVCFNAFTLIGDRESMSCCRCSNKVCRTCVEQMRNRVTGALDCPFCRSKFSDGGEYCY